MVLLSGYNFEYVPRPNPLPLNKSPYEVKIRCEEEGGGGKDEPKCDVHIITGDGCFWNAPMLPCEFPFLFVLVNYKLTPLTHRIGGNRERRFLNNFSFSIAKINVFDCLNRYNGNRKRLI